MEISDLGNWVKSLTMIKSKEGVHLRVKKWELHLKTLETGHKDLEVPLLILWMKLRDIMCSVKYCLIINNKVLLWLSDYSWEHRN